MNIFRPEAVCLNLLAYVLILIGFYLQQFQRSEIQIPLLHTADFHFSRDMNVNWIIKNKQVLVKYVPICTFVQLFHKTIPSWARKMQKWSCGKSCPRREWFIRSYFQLCCIFHLYICQPFQCRSFWSFPAFFSIVRKKARHGLFEYACAPSVRFTFCSKHLLPHFCQWC